MASSPDYLEYIRGQLSAPEELTARKMMGEYLLYYRGKLVGGIYDDRLLVKPIPAAVGLLPTAPLTPPYPGAKAMLLVEEVDDRDTLQALFSLLARDLPQPTKKKK